MESETKTRKVFDNIYGFIEFPKKIWKFVDTPEFQRLRNIKQLGCLCYVFPGATHTRFQHSLGTAHLARTYLEILMKNHPTLYIMSEHEKNQIVFTMTLAGLMHDIGHGPFSHTFDSKVVKGVKILEKDKAVKPVDWEHEQASEILFRYIVEHNNLEPEYIKPEQVERVVRLIHGRREGQERRWEFELISNKDTGIDVDKLDYFRRDAYYLGAKGIHINQELLMKESRIIDERICYPTKYIEEVNEIFYSRFKLYKTYYFNSRSIGIEFMICDILNLVEPIQGFKFKDICAQIKLSNKGTRDYARLTDYVIEKIADLDYSDQKYSEQQWDRIDKAQKLINRIKTRDIYKFVRQVQTFISQETLNSQESDVKEVFSPENIIEHIVKTSNLTREEFCVSVSDAGYGKVLNKANPLDQVKFFRKYDKHRKTLSKDEFESENSSMLYTKNLAERYAKLYVKNMENFHRANEAFKDYFRVKKESKKTEIVMTHSNLGQTEFYGTEYQSPEKETTDPIP